MYFDFFRYGVLFVVVFLTAGLSEDVFQPLGHPSLVRVLLLAALHPQSNHLLDPQQSSQQVLCATENKIQTITVT